MTKEFTYQELLDFIHQQPDDKTVEMTECTVNEPCGCLLIQFWRARTKQELQSSNSDTSGAGYSRVGELAATYEDKEKVSSLIRQLLNAPRSTTFGKIKPIADSINH